jgi:hypothetical protein
MYTLLLYRLLTFCTIVHALQVVLATLLSSHNVSLKPDHPVPRGINDLGYTPDAVHIILHKL